MMWTVITAGSARTRNLPRGHAFAEVPAAIPPLALRSKIPNSSAQSERLAMYHHVKKLMYTVRVDEPDPRFGNMLLEQFGGATANWQLPCSIRYKASTAMIPAGRICLWTSARKK